MGENEEGEEPEEDEEPDLVVQEEEAAIPTVPQRTDADRLTMTLNLTRK